MRTRRRHLAVAVVAAPALAVALAGPALGAGVPSDLPPVAVPLPAGVPGPPVTPVTATPPARIGTLDDGHPILTFTGSVGNQTPLPAVADPSPPACALFCQEYQFRDVARGTDFLAAVKNTAGGPTFDPNDGYDLYVYDPAGKLVGSSNGVGSNGQAALVTPTATGTYTVVVSVTYAYDPGAGWAGEVRLITPQTWTPPPATCSITVAGVTGCFDLPTLRVLPPYDFTASGVPPVVSTPVGFPLPVSLPTTTSCYADESIGLDNPSPSGVENPVTRCLRFTSDVQNTGAGPLSVGIPLLTGGSAGQPQSGYLPGQCHAVQYVTEAGGTTVTRPAGDCEFHVEHGHFHYYALVGYSLHSLDATGSIGPSVSVSHKESFCLTDDDYFGFGTGGPNGPHEYVGQPDCNLPRSAATPSAPGTGTYVTEGITPGWGDVYTWDTPDQYIDVTRVPSGTYWVVEETNPSNSILVAGLPQTCSATEIRLSRGSNFDTIQPLQSLASVTCPA
ncbi:MAG TPA: hypothetical protein VFP54_04760 [Acidimicrobiales bacterium]|nr:hypothetical protein [Acidimicrobiales bacterium]